FEPTVAGGDPTLRPTRKAADRFAGTSHLLRVFAVRARKGEIRTCASLSTLHVFRTASEPWETPSTDSGCPERTVTVHRVSDQMATLTPTAYAFAAKRTK